MAEEHFDTSVLGAETPVLVDFYADWCQPCKAMAPAIDEIASEHAGTLLVAKVPMLCQRCHAHTRHPSTPYDETQVDNNSNRVLGRGCVKCHQNVHGSNHPSGALFLR